TGRISPAAQYHPLPPLQLAQQDALQVPLGSPGICASPRTRSQSLLNPSSSQATRGPSRSNATSRTRTMPNHGVVKAVEREASGACTLHCAADTAGLLFRGETWAFFGNMVY